MVRRISITYGALAAASLALARIVAAGDVACSTPCTFPNPPYFAPLGVNLKLSPAFKKDLLPGEIVDVSLFAQRTQGVPTLVAGVEAVLTWENDKLELCGLWNNGSYAWLQSKFPNDNEGAVLNAGLHNGDCGPQPTNQVPFNDGDAFYSAIAHFPPPVGIGEAVLPTGAGLLVATFQFRVVTAQPLDATIQILPNLDPACTTVAWGRGGQCSNAPLPCNPLVPTSCSGGGTCVPLEPQPGCDMLSTLSDSHLLGPCGVPCGDADNNGISDDSCIYWDCQLNQCLQTPREYADMGGPIGNCAPDGACDGNDRFHALNCFSNLSTGGLGTTYPCESDPPSALNVDVARLGSPCSADGVCDANDAFAALNCFSGSTPCSCDGPAPSFQDIPLTPVGRTRLAARAAAPTVQPGEEISIDVYLEDSLDDLRGYQLHLQPTGGKSGRLQLVDISIREESVFSLGEQGPKGQQGQQQRQSRSGLTPSSSWSAFNIRTHQMLAGLDSPGVPASGGAYLATFTYVASDDASGTFTVEILADPRDDTQRTVLFPTPADGWIAVESTTPAVVKVMSPAKARSDLTAGKRPRG